MEHRTTKSAPESQKTSFTYPEYYKAREVLEYLRRQDRSVRVPDELQEGLG